MFKFAVVAILLVILASLGSALFALMKNDQDSNKMVKALTIRIALSIGLLIFIMIGFSLGLIAPHGL